MPDTAPSVSGIEIVWPVLLVVLAHLLGFFFVLVGDFGLLGGLRRVGGIDDVVVLVGFRLVAWVFVGTLPFLGGRVVGLLFVSGHG